MFNNNTWESTRTIQTPCSYYGTLKAYRQVIFVACAWYNSIHKLYLDDTDNDFETIAEKGDTVGKFDQPLICDIDSEGRLLVADRFNDRLQVYSAGAWRVPQLLPQPSSPRDAVYANGILYVTGGFEQSYYLTMYTQT